MESDYHLRHLSLSLCLSFRMENSAPTGGFSLDFALGIYTKICTKNENFLKFHKSNRSINLQSFLTKFFLIKKRYRKRVQKNQNKYCIPPPQKKKKKLKKIVPFTRCTTRKGKPKK